MSEQEKKDALIEICRAFIERHHISCAEATAEDRVYENAPDLVESIASIVGYYKWSDCPSANA